MARKKDEILKKWIRTKQEWYPTIPANNRSPNQEYDNPLPHPAVWVRFMHLSDGKWRVCVWGGDDFGLEKDFSDKGEARELYRKINDFTLQEEMREWGMYRS